MKQHLLVYCVFVMEKLDFDCGESNCLEIFLFFFISENHILKLDLFAIVRKDFCFSFCLCNGKVYILSVDKPVVWINFCFLACFSGISELKLAPFLQFNGITFVFFVSVF